jgi:hypothetical protein
MVSTSGSASDVTGSLSHPALFGMALACSHRWQLTSTSGSILVYASGSSSPPVVAIYEGSSARGESLLGFLRARNDQSVTVQSATPQVYIEQLSEYSSFAVYAMTTGSAVNASFRWFDVPLGWRCAEAFTGPSGVTCTGCSPCQPGNFLAIPSLSFACPRCVIRSATLP